MGDIPARAREALDRLTADKKMNAEVQVMAAIQSWIDGPDEDVEREKKAGDITFVNWSQKDKCVVITIDGVRYNMRLSRRRAKS